MKITTHLPAFVLLLALQFPLSTANAQSTAFTYQGRLSSGGVPANGSYDVAFTLYAANNGGVAVAGPVTNSATFVTNGLFTTAIDFGAGVFTGGNYWLELAVQTNGGSDFITLAPRQPILPAPYAIYSANAGSAAMAGSANAIAATNITGTIPFVALPAGVLTNGANGVTITGAFSGNGSGLTNMNLAAANSNGALTFATNWGSFTLASSPKVGNRPYCVIAADVNGDGKLDLISANVGANTLTVLTNDGRGGFVLSSSPTAGSSPFCVVAADVNGDGKLDLISANFNGNTLTVLTNDGRGGFAIASSPTVGSQPTSVTAADVNGDGKMDLICANYGNSTLTVLTNNGSGGFVIAASPVVGNGPYSVTAADVNGDGLVDLISANLEDNTLTVLTNNGRGGFVLAASPGVGGYPYCVVAVDVNGDHAVDLISANYYDGTLTVLTNDGRGGFTIASSPVVGNGPVTVTAADVNGDGRADLISANLSDNTLTVLTNDGGGGFVAASSPPVGSAPCWVTAADVNGDGRVDLISASSNDNTLAVLTNGMRITGFFKGDGSGLTGLTASQITSGTFAAAQIPNLDASKITSGTLADALLSANVALLNASQTFTGANIFNSLNTFNSSNIFNGNVGINTSLILEGSFMINTNTYLNAHPIYLRGGDEGVVDHHHGLAYTGAAITNFGNGSFQYVDGPALWGNGGGVLGTRRGGTDSGALVWTTGGVSVYGTFNNNSDRNAKQDISAVTPAQILDKVSQLPVSEWSYKVDASTRHIGPMAQDFYSAFNIGTDDKHIAPIDEGGVALAAIQGLNQKLEAQNAELKKQNDALAVRVNELEITVKTLVGNK
jgi:hypothetical protein